MYLALPREEFERCADFFGPASTVHLASAPEDADLILTAPLAAVDWAEISEDEGSCHDEPAS